MRNYLKRLVAASFLVLTLSFSINTSYALPQILPFNEVVEGMEGTAYTVIDSSGDIKTFPIQVVGLMKGGKGSDRMIMARTSGYFIESVGGVLQGMSGSPVYINGKLVGAVAAGLKNLTPYTFFITPIEDMTALWDLPDNKNKTQLQTINVKEAADKRRQEEEDKANKELDKKLDKMNDSELEAYWHEELNKLKKPVEPKTTFFTSGFSSAGLNFMRKQLGEEHDFFPMSGAGADNSRPYIDYNATLEGGSPVGVALVYGDFSVGATGTVTAVDGKNILAFGHPFLHKGNVNYFLTGAEVVGTVEGTSNGVKIANINSLIGRVNQDRSSGIAGILGEFPAAVPLKVTIKDSTLGREESFSSHIAYDEDLIAALTASITYSAISKVSDSSGSGTAKVSFNIRTNALDKGRFERSNMYYSQADVGQMAILELLQTMNVLSTSTEREIDIVDVDVTIELASERQTATLISAVPDKTTVKAGEEVTFTTTLKPYRKPEETYKFKYIVPEMQLPGTLNLDIRGGGIIPVTPAMLLEQVGVMVSSDEGHIQSTEDKLNELKSMGQNNEIIIAPGASPVPLSEKEQKRLIRESEKIAQKQQRNKTELANNIKQMLQEREKALHGEPRNLAPYIIENIIHATLKVEADK